jgi:hypothetical protein
MVYNTSAASLSDFVLFARDTAVINERTVAVYDSIWVGVDVYANNGSQYMFRFRNDTMLVIGGSFSDTVKLDSTFRRGCTLYFKISAESNVGYKGTTPVQDSIINIIAKVNINNQNTSEKFNQSDISSTRLKDGFASVYLDFNGKENNITDVVGQ